jgi:hypothetical protein
MPNFQTFPQSIYPINGDVASANGDPDVTVQGIQGTPVLDQRPDNGQILIYDSAINAYVPGDPIVSGPDPVGTPNASNPVQVGGTDGVLVREALTDPNGAFVISSQAGIGELLYLILYELRAIKAVLIAQDNQLLDGDFNVETQLQNN